MRILQQQKAHTSNQLTSNRPFFRPNAVQLAKINSENSDKMETNSVSPKQAKAKPSISSSFSTNSNQGAQAKNETGMPEDLKSGLETLSGEDLSGVRVHRNSSKPEAIQAYAFAQGQDIHLAPGQEKHLPHEGWHVVQQMQGRVQPTIQKKDTRINDDAALEKEADIMGAKAVQMKAVQNPKTTNNTRFAEQDGVIQRAMKFEYQFQKQHFLRDNGKGKITKLPRKFGPRDYIMRSNSGATMESESRGEIEFETPWEKKWSVLGSQVRSVRDMSKSLKNAKDTLGSDKKPYKKFPYPWMLNHLFANKGFSGSGGKWSTKQNDGSAKVNNKAKGKNFENLRADDKSIILAQINNGTKVFVHYTEGNWARIKYNNKWGWIWKSSLGTMDTENFENNESDDKQLGGKETILVEKKNADWTAYVQISESFALNQYASYLKQYDKQFYNSNTLKIANIVKDQDSSTNSKSKSMLLKEAKRFSFFSKHYNLYNFLLMIAYYIDKGDNRDLKGKPAKFAFPLMSRTHFGSMYKSMTKPERVLFDKLVKDKKNGILKLLGVAPDKKIFKNGSGSGTNFNPTVLKWLEGITKGKDILSTQESSVSSSMGRFNVGSETGKHKGLVRFEAREVAGNTVSIDKMEEHAKSHFDAAKSNRNRTDKTKLD